MPATRDAASRPDDPDEAVYDALRGGSYSEKPRSRPDDPDEAVYECPYCKARLGVARDLVAQSVQCANCQRESVVPDIDNAPFARTDSARDGRAVSGRARGIRKATANRLLLAAAVIVPSASVILAFLLAKPASEHSRPAGNSMPARGDAAEADIDRHEREDRERSEQRSNAADDRGVPADVKSAGAAAEHALAVDRRGPVGDAKENGKPAQSDPSDVAARDAVGTIAEYRELIELLTKSGVGAGQVETSDGAIWGPAAYLTFDKDVQIYVQVRRSEQEAKEIAATDSGTFAWHNLYLKAFDETGEAELDRIVAALNADR